MSLTNCTLLCRFKYGVVITLICCAGYAQLPHTFDLTAATTDHAYAFDALPLSDSIILVAFGQGGLHAYHYNGDSLTLLAKIDDGGTAKDVAVSGDGTIFLANGNDGLRSYTFDGASFTNKAHIHNSDSAQGVIVGTDGTVFLANGRDGLRSYAYDGAAFTNTSHINEGDNKSSARDVIVDADGIAPSGLLPK